MPIGGLPPVARARAAGQAIASWLDAQRASRHWLGMMIYKVLRADEWSDLRAAGRTEGAPVDRADGFIHFSTAEQLPATLAKHFAGEDDLTLLACASDDLGESLKWEVSRGGALFPHLYRPLDIGDIRWNASIRWDGTAHVLPEDVS